MDKEIQEKFKNVICNLNKDQLKLFDFIINRLKIEGYYKYSSMFTILDFNREFGEISSREQLFKRLQELKNLFHVKYDNIDDDVCFTECLIWQVLICNSNVSIEFSHQYAKWLVDYWKNNYLPNVVKYKKKIEKRK